MFIDCVKVDNAFAETLAPDGSERLLDGHVCLQQRLIDASMWRDRVVEIRQRGRIGHAVALHRPIVNANFEMTKSEARNNDKKGVGCAAAPSYPLSVIGKNFAWMIFLPITYGTGDGHVARVDGFVVSCQFFGRAIGY